MKISRKKHVVFILIFMVLFLIWSVHAFPYTSKTTQLTNNNWYDDFDAVISDNGEKIAFVQRLLNVEIRKCDIWVINPDGTGLKELTNNGAWNEFPSISSDGSRIAFESSKESGTKSKVTVINSDGTGYKELTNEESWVLYPSISGNGEKIAFMANFDGDYDIWVINYDGTGLKKLTQNDLDDEFPSINYDGSRIVFHSGYSNDNREIWVVNSDGSGLKLIHRTHDEFEGFPSISGDGTIIAFEDVGNIWVINYDGTGLDQVTDMDLTRTKAQYPDISSDGKRIVFYACDIVGESDPSLYVINIDGSGLELVSDRAGLSISSDDINSDGSRIVYTPIPDDKSEDYEIFLWTRGPEPSPDTGWVWGSVVFDGKTMLLITALIEAVIIAGLVIIILMQKYGFPPKPPKH